MKGPIKSNLEYLVTHERDDDKHKVEGHWTHWTANGTFEIKSNLAGGQLIYELFCNGKLIGPYLHISTAIADVLSGDRDQDLGFSGKDSGLPESLSEWNNR